MTGLEIIAVLKIVAAGIDLAKNLAPQIESLFASGNHTPEEQAEILALVEKIEGNPSSAFGGPEWTPSSKA